MVASTNHLDKLDKGLSSRPSRFDRKYLFPLPSEEERTLYCQFWRRRLKERKVEIEFPMKICPAAALITDGFSFAYLQEAFVATLLAIAGRRAEVFDEEEDEIAGGGKDGDRDLDDYELWREMKRTIQALRDDMENKAERSSIQEETFAKTLAEERNAQAPAAGADSESKAPFAGQSQTSLQRADDWSGQKLEAQQVQGRALRVDYQGAPIICEDNAFVYSSE